MFKAKCYILVVLFIFTTKIQAASNTTKCDAACASNPLCSTGTCSMSKCTDSGTGCLNFCLRCAGKFYLFKTK